MKKRKGTKAMAQAQAADFVGDSASYVEGVFPAAPLAEPVVTDSLPRTTRAGLTPIAFLLDHGLTREQAHAYRAIEAATLRRWRGKALSVTAPIDLRAAKLRAHREQKARLARLDGSAEEEEARTREESMKPTAERAGKAEIALEETMRAGTRRARVKHECKMDWYWDKCSIDDRQHQAGIEFRRLFLLAAATTHVTGGYGQRISGNAEFSAAQITARNRLRRAYMALGQDYTGVLIRVCGMDEWASGDLPTLRLALDGLGDHWGMPREGAA